MSIVCLAREPILDRDQTLIGYELLYRDEKADFAGAEHANDLEATHALFAAFSHIGEERVAGPFPPFINLSQELLMLDDILALLPENAIVEVLEDSIFDDALFEVLTKIKNAGFEIAFEQFVYSEEIKRFIPLADIIKLDVSALSGQDLFEHVDILRKHENLKLLAEKVENESMYGICRDLGFDYFQGFYLGRPELLTKGRILH